MGMMINRRRAYGGKSLPYDAEIEYLESTGTQYIDTGIIPTKGTDTTITFQFTSLDDDQTILGIFGPGNFVYGCTMYKNKWYFGVYSSEETCYWLNKSLPDTNKHIIRLSGDGKLYQDGTLLKEVVQLSSSASLSIHIFERNRNTYKSPSKIKCYSVTIYDKDGILVRNYIPVRVGTTGYLYDKVSGQLFGNQGTGNFILGPDVN